MKSRRIKWAGVELQPDLQNPKKPVRLGVVLVSHDSSGESSFLILGRKPKVDPRPPELNDVSHITFELATNWIENMVKDILEARPIDPIGLLIQRWRWNLYLIRPGIKKDQQAELLTVAKELYLKFVGQRFKLSRRGSTARQATPQFKPKTAGTPMLPPAWLVEEITRRCSAPEIATTR